MNPFNLPGPDFLAFYVTFGTVLIAGACIYWFIRTRRDGTPVLTNPYEIAYLRGGAAEAVRVAVIGLLERNILEADDTRVVRTFEERLTSITDPFERKIAEYFSSRGAADSAAKSDELTALCAPFKQRLERDGLIVDAKLNVLRCWLATIVLSGLWIVALTKIGIALERGKSNVGFLILFMIVGSVIAAGLLLSRDRTAAGNEVLERLRAFHRTTFSVTPGTGEMLMYAAVFGAAAAPLLANPYVRPAGSSCGSASTCGGGDGGSGGGGGCGGCGGGGD